MRVVWLKEFGRPEVLVPGDAPSPFKRELPMIPGNGVGGIITAVGEGVDSALVGQS
ncbi:hypothetical protein AB0L53_46535 [Nonomuraea sp. NPDC052129]|uniref:hypothetical protein n=1 Tax=Nonomuraea sp. NPDC052129 TaxID=3154651 RepID=UPI00341E9526